MNEEIENILYREDISLADRKNRAMAFFIDDFLISLVIYLSFSNMFTANMNNEELIEVIKSILFEIVFLKILYQTFFVMKYGATIGKVVMKIRVIDINTLENPNILVALNRAIFRIISHVFYGLGFLWGMFDPARQTWHDKTAKTLVTNV